MAARPVSWLALAVVAWGVMLWAPAASAVESAGIERFSSITPVPLRGATRGSLRVEHDRVRGEVVLTASSPFREEWLEAVRARVAVSDEVAALELLDRSRLLLRLRVVASDYVLVDEDPEAGYLILGRLRRVQSLRPHFFGERCAVTWPTVEHPTITAMIASYCAGAYAAPTDLPPYSQLSAVERELVGHLRAEVNLVPGELGRRDYDRLLYRTRSDSMRVFALVGWALTRALQDELPAALRALGEARTTAVRSSDALTVAVIEIDALGGALYERLLRGAASSLDAEATVAYAAEFESWSTGELPASLLEALAQAYRDVGRPEGAADIYVRALPNAGPEDEPRLLLSLIETYQLAGDSYRAYETQAYLLETYPAFANRDTESQAEGDESADVEPPVMTCGDEPADDDPLTLLVQLGCAYRQDATDRALEYARRLQRLPDEVPEAAHYRTVGALWEESLRWEIAD